MLRRQKFEDGVAARQLRLWLCALNRVLSAAEERQRTFAKKIAASDPKSNCLSGRHAQFLLSEVDRLVTRGEKPLPPLVLNAAEARSELALIEATSKPLPFTTLCAEVGLNSFERAALIITLAPEISPFYSRLFGYVLDDLTRGTPSIELILNLTSGDALNCETRRQQLGPAGQLRRLGLLNLNTESGKGHGVRTELELGHGLMDWLNGAQDISPIGFSDPALITTDTSDIATVNHAKFGEAINSLKALRGTVGVWGINPAHHDDVVMALANSAGLDVYQVSIDSSDTDWRRKFRDTAEIAAGCNTLMWLRIDPIHSAPANMQQECALLLAGLTQPIVLTGRHAWRPLPLLSLGHFVDMNLDTATVQSDSHFGWRERRAVQVLASEGVKRNTNGATPPLDAAIASARQLVAAPQVGHSVSVIKPRRGPDELILASPLHAQVMEVCRFFKKAEPVDRDWGFGRLSQGAGSIKALFTGDPGTGKTLAAEVIAKELGLEMLKVDLSQVVSKWVGETEKNLEEVFLHAENSHAVLFIDEADALFGKRGQVKHGTDRYANLEISYLLQRLESFANGLVILASNLRDEIDPAFTRRFQITLHFPRPEPEERCRLWRLAFSEAPLDPAIKLSALVELELTGGGIVTTARMSALLAAAANSPVITMDHIGEAVERQFRKEARLMRGRPLRCRSEGLTGLAVAQERI